MTELSLTFPTIFKGNRIKASDTECTTGPCLQSQLCASSCNMLLAGCGIIRPHKSAGKKMLLSPGTPCALLMQISIPFRVGTQRLAIIVCLLVLLFSDVILM